MSCSCGFGSFKQRVTGLLQNALFCLFSLTMLNVSKVSKLLEECVLKHIAPVFSLE